MSRSTVQSSIRRLRNVLAAQSRQDESDEQLLHAFLSRHDDSAFAVLVHRHGPMVLRVCRRVLRQQQDAEDAFQATFLVLARNAASLRNKTALAGFLHGTAYRIAMKAKQSAARRRKHEGRTPPRAPADPADELLWREARTLLDEEIARLPENYRSVFVLCVVENLSQVEAGKRLGLKERTVSNRLAEARKRLGQRLAKRGMELTAVLSAISLAMTTASALPPVLMTATIEAALATTAGEETAGLISMAVAELVKSAMAAMLLSKTKIVTVMLLAAGLLTGAGLWVCLGQTAPLLAPSSPPSARKADAPPTTPKDKANEKSVAIHGRVLDPDDKPAANARVYVNPRTPDEKPMASAMTGKDGRFSLTLARSALMIRDLNISLRNIRLVAMAKGCGLDWLDVPLADAGQEATLRLVKDDVPIQGRLLSLEGKPLAGIKVSAEEIEAFPKGDLNRALQAKRSGRNMETVTDVRRILFAAADPGRTVRTDADGRFRLDGIGRDRIVRLKVEGPRIHYSRIRVMTRTGETVRDSDKRNIPYGAAFEYPVRPSRLIRGAVREKGTGKVLAGIGISALNSTAHVRTDTHGRYELPGCPKDDSYGVMASPVNGEPYFNAGVSVKDTEGLGPITADLEMTGGISLEGKVIEGETDKPVMGYVSYFPLDPNPNIRGNIGLGASASERMSASGPVSSAMVHADGSFRCVVLPGRGCLAFRTGRTANANRYARACVDPQPIGARGNLDFLMVQEGGGRRRPLYQQQFQAILLIDPAKDCPSLSKTIRLKVATGLRGTVLDGDGKPLSGVRVRGLEEVWSWDDTLATEKFHIHGVNPLRPRRLYFVHTARRLIGTLEVKGTETKPLTVRLQPWAAVRGRLVDAEGRPVRNAELHTSEFQPEMGRTDAEGRFRLEGLVPDRRYDIYFEKNKPSASGVLIKGFIGKPGEVRDLGDVRAKPQR